MGKKRIYGLERDQIGRLLSLGTAGAEEAKDKGPRTHQPCTERPGTWVGRYHLLRVLGEGGMGMVYLAEQEHPIRRQVALKVIKPGMDSRRVIARFEAERQTLALLDHRNIAHVYDAGTTESGRPYFVMEHVQGQPITEYCDKHKLTIEQRLRLFQRVCDAVQHAHQKGIIHRDLKPSNILVAAEGDKVIPKIIDFGVAKAIAAPLTERTLATEDSHLLGTPEYMSPEQADMATEDVDTRSDVYSLGVLLYELLTGTLPFDSDTLRTGGIEHIRQVIRESDPKTPSTRLTKLGDEARTIAQNRRTEIRALARHLHRELEWIPLKAMRKDRAERYRSALELANDIGNYLQGAPLLAGPPGAAYRLKKFVRRHRPSVAAATLVVASLLFGLAVSISMYLRAERSRQAEATARAEAETVINFLRQDLLGSAQEAEQREPTLRYVLDRAAESLEGRFKDHPLVEAQLRRMLGVTYIGLGDPEAGFRHRERGCRIVREHLGETHPQTFDDTNWLGVSYSRGGRYKEAEALFERVIQQAERDTSRKHDRWMRWFKCNLAGVYRNQGRYQEAEQLFRTTLETRRYWDTETQGWRIYGMGLADTYVGLGQYDEAERIYHQSMKLQRQAGQSDPHRLGMNNLARLYVIQGRYQEAEDLLNEALEIWDRSPSGMTNLVRRLVTVEQLAVLRREQGRYEEAERLLAEVYDGRQTWLGSDDLGTLYTMHELAVLYVRQARYEGAERLLLDAYHGREAKLGPKHPRTIDSLRELVRLYEAWDKPDEAAKWRAKLPQTKAMEE